MATIHQLGVMQMEMPNRCDLCRVKTKNKDKKATSCFHSVMKQNQWYKDSGALPSRSVDGSFLLNININMLQTRLVSLRIKVLQSCLILT